MPTETDIEDAVAALIVAAIPATNATARKTLNLLEGESVPRVMVRCAFDRGQAGHNEDSHRFNGFYTLYVRMFDRNNKAKTGDNTIKTWQDQIVKLLFGPTIAAVPVVSDITPMRASPRALAQTPPGVDSALLQFEVETYESLT